MSYVIKYRSQLHPGLAGVVFVKSVDVEPTKIRLAREGYLVVSVTKSLRLPLAPLAA
jgi:hypothetical protein